MNSEIGLTCFICINVATNFGAETLTFCMRRYKVQGTRYKVQGNARDSERNLFILTSEFVRTDRAQNSPVGNVTRLHAEHKKKFQAQGRDSYLIHNFQNTSGVHTT